MAELILAINPGSTSTKVALFDGEEALWEERITHRTEEILAFARVVEQLPYRRRHVEGFLEARGVQRRGLKAVVGRGGLVHPVAGGTYLVNDRLVEDLRTGRQGEHASNLGGLLAREIADPLGVPAFIVDPVAVDEFDELARVSGLPEIRRRSLFHALNQKAVARRAARDLGYSYTAVNFIVAHLGGGITVGAHRQGRVIDVNHGIAEGPFSPERAGGLPTDDLVRLALSGQYDEKSLIRRLTSEAGLFAHLGTKDAREIEGRVAGGDRQARLIFEAMAYGVAKEIGAMATALFGQVQAILLTGGLAWSELLTGWISERVQFIAPVLLYPGEEEMRALVEGALRVLRGEEQVGEYL
ncbi:MAG: butyrate kinase [Firmicutes bacterium]|nr:butyrate kinase [Bacillota bacterium]